ncbi:MAG: signal peptidase II [Lachnospiraceae bacterium]
MTQNKKKMIHLLFNFLCILCFVFIDQITKYFAILYLKDKPNIPIIENVFVLHYLENRGAAFGILQNQKIFFVVVSFLVLSAICFILYKMPMEKKYYKLELILVFVFSGAVGNLVDRIRLDYVVDFFYFILIDFPIFNVADIYVTVSCVFLGIFLLFFYKEEDFDFLNIRQQKTRKIDK